MQFCWFAKGFRLLFHFDSHVVRGNLDTQLFTAICHVLIGGLGCELNFGGSGVSAVDQDFVCHVAGDDTQVIVVDGQGCHAAAGADAGFASDDGHLSGFCYVVDGFSAGSCGVIGGDTSRIIL